MAHQIAAPREQSDIHLVDEFQQEIARRFVKKKEILNQNCSYVLNREVLIHSLQTKLLYVAKTEHTKPRLAGFAAGYTPHAAILDHDMRGLITTVCEAADDSYPLMVNISISHQCNQKNMFHRLINYCRSETMRPGNYFSKVIILEESNPVLHSSLLSLDFSIIGSFSLERPRRINIFCWEATW